MTTDHQHATKDTMQDTPKNTAQHQAQNQAHNPPHDQAGAVPPPAAERFVWQGVYTDAMAAAWARDGFLVLDGFVSLDDCRAMLARAQTLIQAFDADAHRVVFSAKGQSHAASEYFMRSAGNISCFLEEEAVDDTGRLTKDKAEAINKIGHALHDLDPVFAPISHNQDFERLAQGLGMTKPLLLQSMVICKQPYIGGEVNTHQDSTFLYTEPETCTGFWLALEDATVENGCMWAAPGGHHTALRQRFIRQGDAMVMKTLDETALPECTTPLPARPGTLVLLHGRLPHLSAPNRSPHSRFAYAVHYIDGTAHYAKDNWLQRPQTMPLKGF